MREEVKNLPVPITNHPELPGSFSLAVFPDSEKVFFPDGGCFHPFSGTVVNDGRVEGDKNFSTVRDVLYGKGGAM